MLKFLLNVFSDNKIIKIITSDQSYLMGNTRLVSLMMSICIFTISLMAFHLQFEEQNNSNETIKFMYALKKKTLHIKLNYTHQRKLGLRSNFLVKYFLDFLHKFVTFFVSLMLISLITLAYFDPGSGYYLTIVLFWYIMAILWAIHFYAILAYTATVWTTILIFLKYRFTEINESIEKSIRTRNINALFTFNRLSQFSGCPHTSIKSIL